MVGEDFRVARCMLPACAWVLLACANGSPPTLVRLDTGGAGGVGDGGSGAGVTESAPVDPQVTREYSWEACGRIPATRELDGGVPLHFGPDGSPVLGYGSVAAEAGVSATFGLDGKISLRAWPGDAPLVEIVAGASCSHERLQLSKSADRVVTYGAKGLCVLDVETQALLWRSNDAVASASFSGDEVVVARAPEERGGATELSVHGTDGTLLRRVTPVAPASEDAAWAWPSVAPDGSTLGAIVGRSSGYEATLWSTADGSLLWARPVGGYGVAVFSEGGDFVLMGDTVFATASGEAVWRTHAQYVYTEGTAAGPFVALAPDGRRFAARLGRGLGVVSAEGGLPSYLGAHSLNERGEGAHLLRSLALSADGKILVSVGQEALRWELNDTFESSRPSYIGQAPYLSRVELDSAAHWAAFGGDGRRLYSLDTPETVYFPESELRDGCVWLQFRFSPDAQFLLSTNWAHELQVYQTDQLLAFARQQVAAVPVSQKPEDSCPTLAFAPDGRQLRATEGALDATQLPSLSGSLPQQTARSPFDDIVISPDGVDAIFSSDCEQVFDDLGETHACRAVLESSRFSDGFLPELTAPFPSFSPEAHWVVAGPQLRHLPSGTGVELDPAARVSLFTPEGDIIVGERDGSLARYCRRE